MAFQILLNVFLAFCWMFLSNSPSAAGFITGYILGMLSLFFFRRFFTRQFYLWKLISIIKLCFIFIKELYRYSSFIKMKQSLMIEINFHR